MTSIKHNHEVWNHTNCVVLPCASVYNETQVSQLQQYFAQLGLTYHLPNLSLVNDGYFAMQTKLCVETVHQSFADPNIGMIIAMRGGYGSARLLPHLDFELIRQHPKPLIGYSDITALLNAITYKTGMITYHGPNASTLLSQMTLNSLKQVVFDKKLRLSANGLPGFKCVMPGEVSGTLMGGNLSVFTSLIGTPYLPTDWKNIILFVEDVGEDVYRIDRMLGQLALAGILAEIKALIFGAFTEVTHKMMNSFPLEDVLTRYALLNQTPCFWGAPFGHVEDMWTLPIGATVYVDTSLGTIHD